MEPNVFGLSPAELAGFRNRRIGFVFQFHHLLPEFTVLENAMMPGIFAGPPGAKPRRRPGKFWNAWDWVLGLTHKVGEISGGEQQRVAIARALAGGPQLLLADEPTGNLDQRTGESVFAMIRELHAERGLTSIIVTHNEKLAAQCDEIWEMEAGKTAKSQLFAVGASIRIKELMFERYTERARRVIFLCSLRGQPVRQHDDRDRTPAARVDP